jgi:Flp pilus assembly protein TadD
MSRSAGRKKSGGSHPGGGGRDTLGRLRYHRREVDRLSWAAGMEYWRAGRAGEAKEMMGWLGEHAFDPELRARARLHEGLMLEREADFREAARVYALGLALEPKDAETWYFLHNNLAYCLIQQGRHADAGWYCRAAIDICPIRHNAHKNLGLVLASTGDFSGAVREFLEATRICPADGRAFVHLTLMVQERPWLAGLVPGIEEAVKECERHLRQGGGQ